MNLASSLSCLRDNPEDAGGGGIERGVVAPLELVAWKHCRGALYEGKAIGLHLGYRLGFSRLGCDLLHLVEQQNAKVLGVDQKATATEQGPHPRRKRGWLQITQGSNRRHQIDRGVQDNAVRCCAAPCYFRSSDADAYPVRDPEA